MSTPLRPDGGWRGRGNEDGIALLIVLLTTTLLTIIVVEFTQSAEVEMHFAMSARNALQAFYLARSGVNVGEALLVQDAKLNHNDSDEDIWALPMPPLPVGDGTVALRVQDEARRLNLNMLSVSSDTVRDHRRDVFRRLFDVLGVDKRVLAAIVDWIDADGEPGADPPGAEQAYYVGLTPPVVVRNGPMLTMRELIQVRGMTPTMFARLEEFVTVLPSDAVKVNVNTAPAEVLYALSEGLTADPGVVDRLISTRREHPFASPTEVGPNVSGFTQAITTSEIEEFVGTTSAYFRIDAVGEVNDVARGIVTIVSRGVGTGVSARTVKRVTWAPSAVNLSLTSQPPSDFLGTLPPLAGSGT
ncbi:MAG: type II secretion system minor pseudopilin GspK [Deltaproteobacteria bacterium]|nr:type II secretion system minor pseudopilin GspK [Deltaproteobacteria bacterium]